MIRIENLVYKYTARESPILNSIDLEITEGSYVALIGPNGCGKTTLVKQFNALLSPGEGEVWVDELNTKNAASIVEIRRRVGMIFQNPEHQIVGMTVEEDVAFGPGNLSLPPGQIRQRVDESLETVGLSEYARCSPVSLSGGQKQLLAIAGVLALHPKYIILDEPTSSLDPLGRQNIRAVLKKLNQQGITIIHITHDMDELVDVNRVMVMDKGRIVLDNSPEQVFSKVEWLKVLGLGVPGVTELMWQLQQRGENVRTNILTIDDACREISSLIRRSRSSAYANRPEVDKYV